MKSNCFNISNFSFETIGIGFYFIPALINHSCKPNSVGIFNGNQLSIVSIEPINVDDEITVTYVEIGTSKAIRRNELEKHFFFTCECNRCITDDYENIINGRKPNADNFEERSGMVASAIKAESNHKDPKMKVLLLNKTLQIINLIYKPTHHLRVYVLNNLYEAYLSLEDWESCIKCVKELVDIYKIIFPTKWPLTGIRYYELGKLEWISHKTKEAAESLTRAKQILSLYFRNNPMFEELCKMEYQAMQELYYIQNM